MNKKSYATIGREFDGMDFRNMSQIMCDRGYKMNHATARNVLIHAMEKIASEYNKTMQTKLNKGQIRKLAKNPYFQSGVGAIIQDIYTENSLGRK